MNPVRFFKELRFRWFYRWLTRSGIQLTTHGSICQWTIAGGSLGPASTVLCAGAGHDISFEKALLAAYGCKIVLLDPSPTGIATVQRENIPAGRLQFLPVALAGQDGRLKFQEPEDSREGSFRAESHGTGTGLEFPTRSLASLMNEQGWRHIDLLKMDIEGCEYEVIDNLLARRLDIRQICVEFHHGRAFGHTRNEMIRAILRLRRAGFDLVHCHHQDHTFLRRQ